MDREIYSLKVYSTRMEYDAFQLELGPEENEAENDYFGMQFNVTLWCRGKLCAKLWGKLYDENRVYGSAMDILNVADPNEPEETALAEAFNDSTELQVREPAWQNIQGFSGYLQGLAGLSRERDRGLSFDASAPDPAPRHEYPRPGGGNLPGAEGGDGRKSGGGRGDEGGTGAPQQGHP